MPGHRVIKAETRDPRDPFNFGNPFDPVTHDPSDSLSALTQILYTYKLIMNII